MQITYVYRNTDCPGYDYSILYPTQPRPSWCGYFCARDNAASPGSCEGYTYVPPGVQSEHAVCWLKYKIPKVISNGGYDSSGRVLPANAVNAPGMVCGWVE